MRRFETPFREDKKMTRTTAAFALCLLLAGGAFSEDGPFSPWEPMGPGGGGGNFRAAVSPYDTELYFAACDMGGFYRSEDAGKSWRMIDGIEHTTIPVIFDPVDENTCYVAHNIGFFLTNGWALSKSEDAGRTWRRLYGFIGAYSRNTVTALALDPDDPDRMWAGMRGEKPGRILRSSTGGRFWEVSDDGIPESADVMALYIYSHGQGGCTLWAVTTAGPYLSSSDGRVWQRVGSELIGGFPDNLAIKASAVMRHAGGQTLYVATEIEVRDDDKLVGGIYATTNSYAPGWQRVWSPVHQVFEESGGKRTGKIVALAASSAGKGALYAAVNIPGTPARGGIWKSIDRGVTWKYILMGENAENILGDARGVGSGVETGWLTRELSWWWGDVPITADQLVTCQSDSRIILRQDYGRTIGSRDGGKSWQQLYTNHVGGDRWTTRGYEVTTCYKVYWNPSDHDKMFIAYTDIGFFRSEDGGKSWIYSLRGARHTNTVYDLAIDADRPERMYAATSGSHDQPAWKTLVPDRDYSRGGVAITEDGGKTWTPLGEESGLPNASCGSIILDPESPVDSRTLYVTSWGQGVYKSTDGGETWHRSVDGIDMESDFNFWRMSRAADGTLYLITTKTIRVAEGVYTFGSGALYTSDDGAASWRLVMKGDWMAYPWDVLCDPVDPETIYVAAYSDPHVIRSQITPGGVYRSRDGGATWQRILEHVDPQRITVEASDTDVIYVGTGHDGVYRTADGGVVWTELHGLPFKNAFGISIDPDDVDTIYVTTFGGGVWKGSAYGSGLETENR